MSFNYRVLFTALFHGFFAMVSAYYLTILNSLEPFVKTFANSSIQAHYGLEMNEPQLAFAWSISTGAFMFGAITGPFAVRYLAERFGRRDTTMLYGNMLMILAGISLSLSVWLNSIELFIVSRFVLGFSRVFSWYTVVFLTECVPSAHRGLIALCPAIGTKVWLLIAGIVSLPELGGTDQLWSYLFLFPIVFTMLHMSIFWYFPKSPKFLYIALDEKEESAKSIRFYHGNDADVIGIQKNYEREKRMSLTSKEPTIVELLSNKNMRIPLFLCAMAALYPAVTGSTLMIGYSSGIMTKLGIENAALFTVLLFHVPTLFAAALCVLVIDLIGRRTVMLIGTSVAIFALILLMSCTILNNQEVASEFTNIITLVAIFLSSVGCAFGPTVLVAILPGELCLQRVRSITWNYALSIVFLMATVSTVVYPPLAAVVSPYDFLPYIILTSVLLIVTMYCLPETKGMTVDELHIRQGWSTV